MDYKRGYEWENDSETYSPEQIESIVDYCGIDVVQQTATHFIAYCPFHVNTYDPAFAIDKFKGLWTCFNPSCKAAGNMEILLARLKGANNFEAARTILKFKSTHSRPLEERLAAIREEEPDFVEFPGEPMERMKKLFWESERPIEYMKGRGFNEDTLDYFDIAYSDKKDMVLVPMHDGTGMLLGFVGRSIAGKEFKNSTNLPKSKTAWNMHRAKKTGETLIITESSFDAMRVHQAGYPNVVALLGGSVSDAHVAQLGKTFTNFVIMTDFDKRIYPNATCLRCRHIDFPRWEPVKCIGHRPGRDLGHSLIAKMPNKRFSWAAYDDTCVYPHDAKDAGDMTDDEIRLCLKNAVSNFEYQAWAIEDADLVVAR